MPSHFPFSIYPGFLAVNKNSTNFVLLFSGQSRMQYERLAQRAK